MKLFASIFLVYSFVFSQKEIRLPSLQPDTILRYDTMFNEKKSKHVFLHPSIQFNEQITRKRIDSLNQITPLELVYNTNVKQHIQYYLFQRKEQVSKLLALSNYFFPIFEEYLDKNELPLELKYIPIIESSLNPNARSYAGAVGLWQFMYSTAKQYNLRINNYLDERKDVYKSTQAACEYLKKAHKIFNNWELAIASYNAGRGNITKSIRRSGGKLNYWSIRPFLPQQTKDYIPALIAAIYVMNFATEYGIAPHPDYKINTYQIDSIYLNRPVKIDHLATVLNIDTLELERLNPSYRMKFIPSLEDENFPIILPYNKVGLFLLNEDSVYNKLKSMELAESLDYPLFSDIEKLRYKVKRGDYLGSIANQYNCKIKDIKTWNDLKTDQIKAGQILNIYITVK